MATKKKAKTKKGGDLVEVWRLAAAAWWASIGAKTEDDGHRRFVVSHGWQKHRRDETRMVTITPPPDWVATGKALAAATVKLIELMKRAGLLIEPAMIELAKDLQASPSIPTVEMIDASVSVETFVNALRRKKGKTDLIDENAKRENDAVEQRKAERREWMLRVVRKHRNRPRTMAELLGWLAQDATHATSRDTVKRDCFDAIEAKEAKPAELPPIGRE